MSVSQSTRFTSIFAVVIATSLIFAILFVTDGSAAVPFRRPVRHSAGNGVTEECRTNAVCGWLVYNASTRVHQRYVATTCRCKEKDICMRSEDDIVIPAYVYRCRDSSGMIGSRRRTTSRPNDTGSEQEP